MEVVDITNPPRRAETVTVKFTGDEFEKLAELFYRKAYADASLTNSVLNAAREAGLHLRRLESPFSEGTLEGTRMDERRRILDAPGASISIP